MTKAPIYSLQLPSQADNIDNDNDKQEAEDYLPGSNFFQSFQDQAQHKWEQISSPYSKATAANLEGFLAKEGDNGEGEDKMSHFLANCQFMNDDDSLLDEIDLVHKIQQKYAGRQQGDDDDDNDANSNGPSLFGLHAPVEAEGSEDENVEDNIEVYSKISD